MFITTNRQKKGSGNYNAWFEGSGNYNAWFEGSGNYNTWFEGSGNYNTWFEGSGNYNAWFEGSGNYNAWFDKIVLWFGVFLQNFLMFSDKCCIVSHFSFNITWLPTILSYLSAIFFRVFHF
jgi:hypothetical protein